MTAARYSCTARGGLFGEWQTSSQISGKGDFIRDPGRRDDSYRNSQMYTSNRERYGNATGTFSISALHYFKKPFFTGSGIFTELSGGSIQQKTVNKSYTDNYPYSFTAPYSDSGAYRYSISLALQNKYTFKCAMTIRSGVGHIDDVTFAVAALNMLDRIAETEKSYTGCNAKHVQKLAALIEKARKRRAFDSRIAFIENIDTLCTLIKESGIAADVSPRTVLELQTSGIMRSRTGGKADYLSCSIPKPNTCKSLTMRNRRSLQCILLPRYLITTMQKRL